MGLMDMVGLQGPFAQWVNSNRNGLLGFASNVNPTARTFAQALQPAWAGMAQGKAIDTQAGLLAAQEAERQAGIQQQAQERNQLLEILQQEAPDLVPLVGAGRSDEAFNQYMARKYPQQAQAGSAGLTPVFLTDAQGNQQIAQPLSTGGLLINGQYYPGIPQGWEAIGRPENYDTVNLGDRIGIVNPNAGTIADGPLVQGGPGTNMNVGVGAGGIRTMTPAPGSPEALAAEQARLDAESQARAGTTGDVEGAVKMVDDITALEDLFENNDGWRVVGTYSRPEAVVSNTAAGQARSLVRSIQSGVAIDALVRLKEASSTGASGFGSLSAPELDLLINDIGALDPDSTDPEIFQRTIARIKERFTRIINQVRSTVPPDKIREWGLDVLLGTSGGAASNTTSTGVTWSIN